MVVATFHSKHNYEICVRLGKRMRRHLYVYHSKPCFQYIYYDPHLKGGETWFYPLISTVHKHLRRKKHIYPLNGYGGS